MVWYTSQSQGLLHHPAQERTLTTCSREQPSIETCQRPYPEELQPLQRSETCRPCDHPTSRLIFCLSSALLMRKPSIAQNYLPHVQSVYLAVEIGMVVFSLGFSVRRGTPTALRKYSDCLTEILQLLTDLLTADCRVLMIFPPQSTRQSPGQSLLRCSLMQWMVSRELPSLPSR